MRSLTPHAVHSHAYLGSLIYPVAAGMWTPAAEAAAHPDVPVASVLVIRKAPGAPRPIRHAGYNPVVFANSSHHLPTQGPNVGVHMCWWSSTLLSGPQCPKFPHSCGSSRTLLASGVHQFLGDCHTVLSSIPFHNLAWFYPVITSLPTYMGNHRRDCYSCLWSQATVELPLSSKN